MEYKFKINKELLTQFFLSDQPPTEEQLREVKKVFKVVMIKHYHKFNALSEDLIQYALLAILERRKSYDPSFSPYNYIYTTFRNEIGNKINKLNKEVYVEDILKLKVDIYDSTDAELPQEVQRYKNYLLGLEEFDFLRIPKKSALNLIIFLRMHESRREVEVPNFVLHGKNIIQVLYKLLKEFTE